MRRIEIALIVILLIPVVVTGAAGLMGLPIQDKLFYLCIGWVFGWWACYLAARLVVWIFVRWAASGSKES